MSSSSFAFLTGSLKQGHHVLDGAEITRMGEHAEHHQSVARDANIQ
jgi:hypothetical protein